MSGLGEEGEDGRRALRAGMRRGSFGVEVGSQNAKDDIRNLNRIVLKGSDDILEMLRVWDVVKMALTTPSRRFKSKTTISGFSSSIFRATYIKYQFA